VYTGDKTIGLPDTSLTTAFFGYKLNAREINIQQKSISS